MTNGAPVSSIPDVIARMQAIDATLPRNDGVAIFNRLYLQVTLAVDSASAGTEFENKDFVDRLDVVFAGLYFDDFQHTARVLASSREVPHRSGPRPKARFGH